MTADKIKPDMTIGQTHIELQRAIMKNACMQGDVTKAVIKLLKITHGDPYVVKKIDEVIAENPKVVRKIAGGSTKPIGFLVGEVMKKTSGRAHPVKTKQLIHKRLKPRKISD